MPVLIFVLSISALFFIFMWFVHRNPKYYDDYWDQGCDCGFCNPRKDKDKS